MTPTGTPASPAAQKLEFGFTLPKTTPAQRSRAARLLAHLRKDYPHAHCELTHSSPHELLVATILSAQATDASVNRATPALFKAFPTPVAFAAASPAQIEPYIRSIGLYRNKAKFIHAAMKDVVEKFGGSVPRTMPQLLTLSGVARKTAGVVLGNAFNINMNVVVDTHVHRLSRRLALAPPGANVQQTERHLMALFPRESWCELSHLLIFHGRYTCKARGVQCCQHPICSDFGQRCELRISAKRNPSEPDASAREARRAFGSEANESRKSGSPRSGISSASAASSSAKRPTRKALSATLADAGEAASDKAASRRKTEPKKRPRKESNL